MSGRNQAMNLTGMLDGIANAFNGMGDAYAFTHNAIRNIARPEVDPTDAKSVMAYAGWARRNGYDDEAARYTALGSQLQTEQEKKAYADANAKDSMSIKTLRKKLTAINGKIDEVGDPADSSFSAPGLIVARDNIQNQINSTVEGMNRRGEASRFGVANAGDAAVTAIAAAEHEQMMAAIEAEQAIANLTDQRNENTDYIIKGAVLPGMFIDPARQRLYEEAYSRQSETLLTRGLGVGTSEYISLMRAFNLAQQAKADELNPEYMESQTALAMELGKEAVQNLYEEMDRQSKPTSDLGAWLWNKAADLFTDQADIRPWLKDEDNQAIITAAIERVANYAPLAERGWDAMSRSEKMALVTEQVIKNLNENPIFAEELAEDLVVKAEDQAELEAQVKIEDMDEGINSPEYQNYLRMVEERYQKEFGIPNIDEIRKNMPEAWQQIQADWRAIRKPD
jgi:hypothetical protein